jgi:phytoene dehydrogenase-like protein
MESAEVVVVGGGMAGLSAAAFLCLSGRSVLLLEKEARLGGFATSFEAGGTRFDLGIEGMRELAPDSFLPKFLEWWGVDLPLEERRELMLASTEGGSFRIRGDQAREDLRAAFPNSAARIDRFFDLNAGIVAELSSGPAPTPPEEMGLLGKLAFGMSTAVKRPRLLRHGFRDSSRVLPELFDNPDLLRVAASKTFEDLAYLGVAHRWEAFGSGKLMYPREGIGALPEAIGAAVARRGGLVRVAAAVESIRPRASGFELRYGEGRACHARKVLVASPMPWAISSLLGAEAGLGRLRKAVAKRRIFPACFMTFISLDPACDLQGANYLADWGDAGPVPVLWEARRSGCELDPRKAPMACVVAGTGKGRRGPRAMTVALTLGWDYADAWGTGAARSAERAQSDAPPMPPRDYRSSPAYRRVKAEVEAIVLERLGARLGPGFRASVLNVFSATPLSFARHCNSPGGSYMGFAIDRGDYGRFFPQRSPLEGLYFAGQWVFPGFGVAGAAASGYYASRALLRDEGDDLDARLRAVEG